MLLLLGGGTAVAGDGDASAADTAAAAAVFAAWFCAFYAALDGCCWRFSCEWMFCCCIVLALFCLFAFSAQVAANNGQRRVALIMNETAMMNGLNALMLTIWMTRKKKKKKKK